MKFLSINVYEVSKTAEIAQVADKVMTNTPGYKSLATYLCLGNPFPGEIPPNSAVAFSILEVDNEEALAATSYPMSLAGANIHRIPIMEVKPGTTGDTERKLRG